MIDGRSEQEIGISWGLELTIVDTPNVIYSVHRDPKKMEKALLKFLTSKGNRFFYLVTTPKMRTESSSFIQRFLQLESKLNNFQFIFVHKNKDPDEEILKLAESLKCPVLSNDKFTQKQYDCFRDKNIEVWSFKLRKKETCLKIHEKWKL